MSAANWELAQADLIAGGPSTHPAERLIFRLDAVQRMYEIERHADLQLAPTDLNLVGGDTA
ncbi:hypothetical protein DFJ75_1708 [Williamsia muralis]|uniref:Uncharacterized protein n=1 Tax=Williamsia marianensis TaxID=85044 RepID=A0A495K0X5_WILMA|nr:hypothetical protein [Williamsia muralis]RKR94903.1 hypothetical protein DFJ75_1708 [Williamsia muralis]